MFLLACLGIAKAETITIGSGTGTKSGLPFPGNWNYAYSEQIYTIAEIGKTGTITSLAFKATEDLGTPHNIDLYLVKTNKSSFSSDTDFVTASESDKVFSGSVTFAVGDWTTLTFSKTFQYDGSTNLCVIVNDKTGSYVNCPQWLVYEATNQSLVRYNDNSGAYNPASPGSTNSNATTSVRAYKNQLQLTFTGSVETILTSINVEGYELPVAGNAPSSLTVPDDAPYYISSFTWCKYVDGSYSISNDASFVEGTSYAVGMTIKAKDGYRFSSDCVLSILGSTELVNPSRSRINDAQTAYIWTVPKEAETPPITSINVEGYEPPVAGEAPSAVTVPDDAPYYISSYTWCKVVDGSYYGNSGNFVAGTSYAVGMTIKAKDGYRFSSDCVLSINGSTEIIDPSSSSIGDANTAYIWTVPVEAVTVSSVIEIGSGESSHNYLPVYSYYNYSLSEQIYTKSELGAAKELTSVSFFETGITVTRNIDIYLKATSKETFESNTDWVNVTETDKVFSGEVTFEKDVWTAIPFDKAFSYDGNSNVLLVVADNTGTYIGGGQFLVFSAISQAIHHHNDNNTYDTTNTTSYSGSLLNVKNQVKFNEVGLRKVPKNLAVTNLEWNSATITWESDASSFILQYKASDSSEWTTISSITTKSYTLTDLKEQTKYNVRIQEEGSSDFATTTFTTPVRFPAPTDIEVLAVTPHSATLNWMDNCGASAWQVAVDYYDNITDAKHRPFILTGLEQGKEYYFVVRAVMQVDGETLYSPWSTSGSFTTTEFNPLPEISSVTTTPNSATITWEGQSESYKVRYRKVVPAAYDFEDGTLQGWTTIDADGDGYDWVLGSAADGIYLTGNLTDGSGHNASQDLVISGSYSNVSGVGALTPDNYLVSPKVALGGSISFYACAQDASYAAEHFGVAVSTTSNADPSAFTMVEEWTMTNAGTPASSRRKAQGTWGFYSVDLSAYEGQEGYVAIRHFGCTDQFILNIDDIDVGTGETNANDWTVIETTEKTVTLEGLNVDSEYEFEVIGIMHGQKDASSSVYTFKTLEKNPAPFDVVVKPSTNTADINWTGYGDTYLVKYRVAEQEKVTETIFSEDFGSGMSSWTTENLNSNSGVSSGAFRFFYTDTPPQYLISPELSGITEEAMLMFQYHIRSTDYPESFKVGYSTTTNSTTAFTWSDEMTYGDDTNWHEYNQKVPAGTKYIAIQCTSNDKYTLYIDNINISSFTTIPTGDWKTAITNETKRVLTGLEKGTTYDFMIESYVSSTDTPAATDIMQFTTRKEIVDLVMDNNGDNESIIYGNAGVYANVTIQNLTLESGKWQGICLPFDIDVENSPLAGADVRTYTSEASDADKLYLNFLTPVTEMKAGTPYIVKMESDLSNPVFENVTIDKTQENVYFDTVTGAFNYAIYAYFTSDTDFDRFFKVSDGKLNNILNGDHLGAFEPYFYVPSGSYDEIYLNTGEYNDVITGVSSLGETKEGAAIYNLAGMRLSKKQKGINIVNGKKVLVK